MVGLLNIQGTCAGLRATTVTISGHLPGEHQKYDWERYQKDDTEFCNWHKARGKMFPIFHLTARVIWQKRHADRLNLQKRCATIRFWSTFPRHRSMNSHASDQISTLQFKIGQPFS
jgi:hypothetical protein